MYTWIVTVSPLYLDSFFTISWVRGRRHSVQHYKIITSSRKVWTEQIQQNKVNIQSGTSSQFSAHIQTKASTQLRWLLLFFLGFLINLTQYILINLKAPMYLSDLNNKMNYWLHIMLLAHYDSSICVHHFVLICLWFNCVKICIKADDVGLLDKLINKHVLCTYTVLPAYDFTPERAYLAPDQKDAAFIQSSIKLTSDPKSVLLTYLREKIHIALFQFVSNKDLLE